MNNKYKFEDFEIDFRKPLGKLENYMQLKELYLII